MQTLTAINLWELSRKLESDMTTSPCAFLADKARDVMLRFMYSDDMKDCFTGVRYYKVWNGARYATLEPSEQGKDRHEILNDQTIGFVIGESELVFCPFRTCTLDGHDETDQFGNALEGNP